MLKGIDVSHWDGKIDWAQVKNAGVGFAYIKATEGTNFVDSQFAHNLAGAKDVGLPFGLYHFLRPDNNGAAQVAA
jgi:GH25 family lysozyme M1 (1,4-beta-N-acetylmuramidase)